MTDQQHEQPDRLLPEKTPAEYRAELAAIGDKLMHAEKMALLGQLVAGIAHEINTPLGALKSNNDLFVRSLGKLTDLLQADRALDDASRTEIVKILDTMNRLTAINEEAAERIVRIVNSLRRYTHAKEQPSENADINGWLDNTLTLVEHEYKNRIEVVREYGQLPKVSCVVGRMNQVFMNLLVNAGQAIAEQGRVTVRTFGRGDEIVIEIEDTGHGIAPEHLARIFDPGFTTKPAGQGTGLGLAIARQIVESHGGRIEVESTVGKGTCFRLVLPVASE